jgi:dolichol kinase
MRPRPAPPAPWGAFPLSELCVLVGLAFAVGGFAGASAMLVACGFALAGLAGMELALREHVARRRSHGGPLAGACGLALFVGLVLAAHVPFLAAAAAGLAASAAVLRRLAPRPNV